MTSVTQPANDATIQQFWSCSSLEKAQSLTAATDSPSKLVLANFISNTFANQEPGYSQQNLDFALITNPKTCKPFGQIPISNGHEVERGLEAATNAFKTWSKTSALVRSKYLQKIADLIEENHELFAVWESIDQGKTLARARVEVDRAVSNFRYFSTFILHQQTAARMIDGVALTYEHRSPAGVFALISPWNMPLYLLTWKIAPCLAFGCTAVAKPSEVTSVTAFLLCEIFRRAQLPPGVVNVVFGDGIISGAALVRSPLVKGVSFTGGTKTGVQIRYDTADQIYKHLSLELGGKNPTLVFNDVDLDKAVETAATAAFENQGEICLCGSRIYVQFDIYEEFVSKFADYVRKNYRCCREGDLDGHVGAVVSRAHYAKIRSYLDFAASENATFATGSIPPAEPDDGFWIDPVVLTGLSTSSRVMSEEIFGPVVTIAPFQDEDDALALANDNPNGLAAILLTRDSGRIRRVGEQLEAGLVWVNCWLVRELGTPFGGMKNSGVGREGGYYSQDVFTVVRTLHIPM